MSEPSSAAGAAAAPDRTSGVLLHLTSLPSPYGVGDMGPEAYRFVEFLARSGQGVWQVLPLNPTCVEFGNSPYFCPSVFAGNPLLISPDLLVRDGFLAEGGIGRPPPFPGDKVDYGGATRFKEGLLQRAFELFRERGGDGEYDLFCRRHASWLDDYALFANLRRTQGGKGWSEWPRGVRERDESALVPLRREMEEEIGREKFMQYLFFRQWEALRSFCRERGVRLFGDLPIYPTGESADVWTHPSFFKLDAERRPIVVAGVPPDYFSKTGQLWGNPVYDWQALRKDDFEWWIRRVEHNRELFDFLRIDHFRGLVACWEVPAGEKTGVNGKWEKVPAAEFFTALFERVPVASIVAEDLGTITADVTAIRRRWEIPGMKVLLFAFGDDDSQNPYLPHNYERECVVYTGTHDNNTARGWFDGEAGEKERRNLFRYLGRQPTAEEIPLALVRMAMRSVADMAVFPMQDLFGLGAEARMNRPAVAEDNWQWRMDASLVTPELEGALREMTAIYGRLPAEKDGE
jgi:4-alpha-glucanotransferase